MPHEAAGSGPVQIPLELAHRPAQGRDDFMVSAANAQAMALIDCWPDWPNPVCVVTGPPGSGKSHLAAVWRSASGAAMVAARDLADAALPELMAAGALVIEGADRGPFDEKAMFHAFNMAREQAGFILVTARSLPAAWGVVLPDLASRLRAAPAVRIGAPDDLLLRAVLTKLFADRQVDVDAIVFDYVLRRMERSLEAAARLVDELDRQALALARPITRALAAEVMGRMTGPGDASDTDE